MAPTQDQAVALRPARPSRVVSQVVEEQGGDDLSGRQIRGRLLETRFHGRLQKILPDAVREALQFDNVFNLLH